MQDFGKRRRHDTADDRHAFGVIRDQPCGADQLRLVQQGKGMVNRLAEFAVLLTDAFGQVPVGRYRFSRPALVKQFADLGVQGFLIVGVTREAELLDAANDRRWAHVGPLRDLCQRLQSGHRVMRQQNPGDLAIGRRHRRPLCFEPVFGCTLSYHFFV